MYQLGFQNKRQESSWWLFAVSGAEESTMAVHLLESLKIQFCSVKKTEVTEQEG